MKVFKRDAALGKWISQLVVEVSNLYRVSKTCISIMIMVNGGLDPHMMNLNYYQLHDAYLAYINLVFIYNFTLLINWGYDSNHLSSNQVLTVNKICQLKIPIVVNFS